MTNEKNMFFEIFNTADLTDERWISVTLKEEAQKESILSFLHAFTNIGQFDLGRTPVMFRGESDIEFEMRPKLCRIAKRMPLEKKLGYEFDSIRYFQKMASHFLPKTLLPTLPADLGKNKSFAKNFFDWLSIMQHYGAPTRLLDWTASMYVALYFAVYENPDKDGCVWVFWLDKFRSTVPDKAYEMTKKDQRNVFTKKNAFIKFGRETAKPIAEVVDSNLKSERMVSQKSLFTVCHRQNAIHSSVISEQLKETYPLEEPFKSNDELQTKLWRIVIPSNLKKVYREYLSKINVSAVTLFPGIEGLGRSVKEIFETHYEIFGFDKPDE